MRIAVFYNAVHEQASLDEKDVLDQLETICASLTRLGHDPVQVPCDLDLAALAAAVARIQPDAGFNLVESLNSKGHLIHLVPTVLETLDLPYAGVSSDGMYLTCHKLVAKAWMAGVGIPTVPTLAAWPDPPPGWPPDQALALSVDRPFLIKSVWEHASVGLHGDVLLDPAEWPRVREHLAERAPALGGRCFAEPYVEGRELNLTVLAGPEGPEVLPPAEIGFDAFPEGKPRILNYAAKWDEHSFEYNHTPRTFDFPPGDGPLLDRVREIALAAWHRFGLRGWARVDFRVGAEGPFVLEVNANPCISSDGGFVATVTRAGMTLDQAIARIVADLGVIRPGAPSAPAPSR
jgi:D-alanine-D-alanine ligase